MSAEDLKLFRRAVFSWCRTPGRERPSEHHSSVVWDGSGSPLAFIFLRSATGDLATYRYSSNTDRLRTWNE